MFIRVNFILWLCCYYSIALVAQTQQMRSIAKFDTQYTLTDANGLPFNRSVLGVEGFPYVFADFKYGNIHLRNGKVTNSIPLQLDLVSHQVHFVSATKEIGIMNGDFIKQISISDTNQLVVRDYIFRTGFPAIDKHKENEFYHVLSEGRIMLIKSMNKSIETNKNEFSGEIVKEFALKEDYYFIADGVIKRLKKDKDFLLNIMSDKRVKINEYMNLNKGSFKNEEYLINLFMYYNSN
ncbi:MAG: hypothetical protein Q8K64_14640 [Sediminibacterium sp.]|nr:hypothetical protein [Sediminibacterium sp.]TXT33956.1 MAG: hypothetical protein FD136_598 [Chitinophagaceae bacterium]